jgi:murein DD-endopeptidase MepM/ murein hydrolase activator NlpD
MTMPVFLLIGAIGGALAYLVSRRPEEEDEVTQALPAAVSTPPAAPPAAPAGTLYLNPLGATPFRKGSGYGPRINPVTGKAQIHNGLDMGAPTGSPIYAVAPGRVVRVFNDGVNGNGLKIQHTDGTGSGYLHMVEPPLLGVGAVVARGQQVGKVGSTGRSTAPHLHFIIYNSAGSAVDPVPLTDLSPWQPVSTAATAVA